MRTDYCKSLRLSKRVLKFRLRVSELDPLSLWQFSHQTKILSSGLLATPILRDTAREAGPDS